MALHDVYSLSPALESTLTWIISSSKFSPSTSDLLNLIPRTNVQVGPRAVRTSES